MPKMPNFHFAKEPRFKASTLFTTLSRSNIKLLL